MRWFAVLSLFAALSAQASSRHVKPNVRSRVKSHPALTFKHVVVIIFENENYKKVLAQPFFHEVAKKGALLTHFMAERHPSQPNYIALIAGSTLGVDTDSNVDIRGKKTIADLLEKKGLHWRVYAENYPGNCSTAMVQGTYVRKHEPFISFVEIQKDPKRCANIVDASRFLPDAKAGKLPQFALYIPNLNDDGHDTGVAYANRWFKKAFGPVFENPRLMKHTLFVATFDESEQQAKRNQIYTVLLGDGVKPGSESSVPYNHYSILRTVEARFHLGSLHRHDAKARVIQGIWK